MANMKRFPSCVALLADQVGSRRTDRDATHPKLLDALDMVNSRVAAIDDLRVTVGDELQGVYGSLGEALAASHLLRAELYGAVELRFGLGGGEVAVVDRERGIQDGSAWWNARAAVEAVEQLARDPGFSGTRTGIVDDREVANPLTSATVRLVDAQLARLRSGARESLYSLMLGLDNRTAAERAGISPSANSQRINNNDLRVLTDAIEALSRLP